MNPLQLALVTGLQFYRWVLSPAKTVLFGPLGHCRYTPTCSAYALEAVCAHGATRGSWLAARRVCRCHPWGGCGDDPVPPVGKLNGGKVRVFQNSASGGIERNPKSEIRNPKEARNLKSEKPACLWSENVPSAGRLGHDVSGFGLRASDFFRASDFGFRISLPERVALKKAQVKSLNGPDNSALPFPRFNDLPI